MLTPLDPHINLISGINEHGVSFGFYGLDEFVVCGIAVVIGGSPRRVSCLQEALRSFEMTVEWL
jgi:hypothetical protein